MKLRLFSAMLAVTVALAVLLIGCGEYGSDPNADSGGVEREPVAASDFGGAAPNQTGPAEHSRPTAGYTHSYDAEAFIKEFDLVAFVVLWDHDFSAENNRDLAILHNDRGLAYMELGRPEKALEDYDEAIDIYPMLAGRPMPTGPSPARSLGWTQRRRRTCSAPRSSRSMPGSSTRHWTR